MLEKEDNMRNKIKRIIAICITFFGILLLVYPYFISKVTSRQIEDSISNFLEIADETEYSDNIIDDFYINSYEENDMQIDDYEEEKIIQNQSTNNKKNISKKASKIHSNKSKVYNNSNSKKDDTTLVNQTELINSDILDYLYTKMQEYNRTLNEKGQNIVDAFSYETPSFDLTQYGLKDNIIAFLNSEYPLSLFLSCKYASRFTSVASSIHILSRTPFAGVMDLSFSTSSSPANNICLPFSLQVITISDLFIEYR